MFDPRLLRAFVTIIEAGSFTLAAERLHMTQSTVSQQLARLEQAVGKQLIDRNARPLQLTSAGEYLISYARRILALQQEAQNVLGDPTGTIPIHIGLPEDIMNTDMALALSAFSKQHRSIRLDVTAGLSRDLMEDYRNGQFDLVIVKETLASADHHATFPEEMAWFESIDHGGNWSDPIPLVTFPQGGLYREDMFERIERERRHWYIAFTSNSLASVLVGVETGLGLSLLPVATTKGYRVREYLPLGKANPMTVSIYAWDKDGLVAKLVEQMTAVLQRRFEMSKTEN
ncbi:LysR family transcriptional regulator [Acinetobacter vivianii]|uniref:LysR family transcriptional regulator n=1 Tax=Acinetobacter vivianii TaxID=1776742 RepID=UPI002DB5B791|nr:LysR family transcriptional regulator [Acinetobacter vivianii]MEB6479307.1 LysR family transcriptional regulator [Acinetobacter vivianii]MEB6656862.1 LysR family transcriptional regulator [Acinetobacter vivianii]